MVRVIKALIVSFAVVGWILPLWFSVDCYLAYVQSVAKGTLDSFPFIRASQQMSSLAFLWFGAASIASVLQIQLLIDKNARRGTQEEA